jgi:hypothetical protein
MTLARSWAAPLLALSILLTGCSDMQIETFENAEPKLALEDYFEGRTKAWGIFEDRFGNLRRQFEVDIVGTWDGETLTLEEDFVYADGEIDRRVWTIEKTGPNDYRGEAADVIGTASGTTAGNAFNWQYTLALEIDGRTWHVDFDDWMFLRPGGVVINKAEVTKWGFKVGEATIFFQKLGDEAEQEAAHAVAAE